MSAAPLSTPSPPSSRAKAIRLGESRLPVVRLRHPRRFRGRIQAAEIFAELLSERGIPNSEVADCIGVAEKEIKAMRSGAAAIGVGDIFTMQRRLALAFLDAIRSAVLNAPEHG